LKNFDLLRIVVCMKWLIVVSQSSLPSVEDITAALRRHRAEYTVWNVGCGASDIVDSVASATHAIVLEAHETLSYGIPHFFTGYLVGKNVPLFFTGSLPSEVRMLTEIRAPFDSVSALIKAINADFPSFVAREKKQSARDALLEEGVPFSPDFFAFHIAANNARLCRLFAAAGLDVNSRDAAGTPMLCMAARHNRKELLEWLLAEGADVNAVSKDRGYTAVMDAVWSASTAIVKILVTKNPDLNVISRDGQPALVLAVGTGNEEICRLLVENGADPTIKDAMGLSAVEYARLFKKPAITAMLEKYVK
jgi:hypothetical protein